MEFSYEVKIPKDRIAVLIGIKGKIKKKIEDSLNIKMIIDSKEGDVVLKGDDSLILLTAQSIVKAIGRGFNPDIALELLNEDGYFEIVDFGVFAGDFKSGLIRLRSRIIGTDGKARKTIEKLTDTHSVIYGKTIGIIGNYEEVELARKAFESLLSGSRHSTVYSWLEKERKKRKVGLY